MLIYFNNVNMFQEWRFPLRYSLTRADSLSISPVVWRRANTQNVSSWSLYGGQITFANLLSWSNQILQMS